MSNKFLFLISLVLALSLASAGYGDSPIFKLDFDEADDVNTEPGFTSFLLTDSGSEVNGVIIDLGGNLDSRRRPDPNSNNDPEFPIPIVQEEMYRDFIFGISPSGIDITLWGLGAGRECKIYIYAYDDGSSGRHVANWTANGEYLLTTDFTGDDSSLWPYDPDWFVSTALYYDFNGIAHADEFGSIFLTCTIDPCSEAIFAFVNALVVIPYGDYNNVEEAHRPQPIDGQEEVPPDVVLSWRPGAYVDEHDVYFGTDFNDVADANTSTAGIYQDTVDTNSYDPPGLLELDRTYYWRVDEVNGLDIWPSEVWSFTTSRSFVVEDFDSYESRDALTDVWEDYFDNNSRAFLQLVKTGEPGQRPVRDGNSVEYSFKNNKSPYYSVAEAALADLPSGIGSDWLSMNVKSLALWFYGQEANPVNSRMYVSLTDGDSNTAKVSYGLSDPREDMNDIKVEEWQEWNIALQEFLDDNPDLDLANVATITIGFGDGSGKDPGIVYFEDITVHVTRCVLAERSDDFAKLDYAPGGVVAGDCVIDNLELQVMANTWLYRDSIIDTNNPGTVGLVGYYPFDDFNDANSFVLPSETEALIFANSDSNDLNGVILTQNMAPTPHPNSTWAILSPSDPCASPIRETAVTWVTPGVIFIDPCNPRPDGNCVRFDATLDPGIGNRITAGRWNPIGNFAIGGLDSDGVWIPGDPNSEGVYANKGDLTLAIWAKWAGAHPVRVKCQGLMGKRGGWTDSTVTFMFECDTVDDPRGSFSLRQYNSAYSVWTEADILDGFIGKWVHLAATYNGSDSNTARLYLNGAEVTSGPFYFSGSDPNTIDLTIGNTAELEHQSVESFNGDLDEAYIFNRALDASEIAYLADTTPGDPLQRDVPSGAEVYEEEPVGQRKVNFKDFALMTDMWLEEQMWP